MLDWQNTPPPKAEGYGMRLLRTPAQGALRGMITCETLQGTPTHYFGGRTVPCLQKDCKACANDIGWLWHGYLSMILPTTHEHVLLELTAQACEVVNNYHEQHSVLRGTLVTATRAGKLANGRVLLQLNPGNLSDIQLPDAPDIRKHMMHIWGIQDGGKTAATYSPDRKNGFRITSTDNGNGIPTDRPAAASRS